VTFRRFVAPLLIALAILIAALFAVAWMPLRNARDAWLHGHDAEVTGLAEHLWPSQYHQLLAAIELTAGRDARAHLDALRGGRVWIPIVAKEEVARRLFAKGRYAEFLAYDAASQQFSEGPEVRLYRAAALTATNRVADADQLVRFIDRAHVDAKKVAALQSSIAQRRGGSYPLIVDRNGGAIANYVVARQQVVAIDSRFAPLVGHFARVSPNDTIETTLDPDVQNAALNALSGFHGAIVAIDPRTNELLAIASAGGGDMAIDRQFEPGSIMKVLTGLLAVAQDPAALPTFPYHCTGDLIIDGRHFGDWVPQGHGTLPAFDDALAQSCNIVFADIGLRLGADKLRAFFKSAGFDGQTDLGAFQAPLGKIIPPVFNRYETAFLAIGLEHESINALHVAMLASMMANRGVLTQPPLPVCPVCGHRLRRRRAVPSRRPAPRAGRVRRAPAPANIAACSDRGIRSR